MPAIAQALGVTEAAGLAEELRALHERELLLVLDNFEHCSTPRRDPAQLVRQRPQLKVSRHEPRAAARLAASRSIRSRAADEDEAVALFCERAQAVKPDFG